MIKTAHEMCQHIQLLLINDGAGAGIVNGKDSTPDSVCEHEVDLDVIVDGYIYNVRVNVNRFSKLSSYMSSHVEPGE